ncbi:hypothetical protein JCM10908_007137 [Rhodotorula pacifica]|uniref:uncharacterized protein n=1 Tax=Rhodotorula pacifica TaxID=1495444 RepID=UPI003175F403
MAKPTPTPALKWAILATASLIVVIWLSTRHRDKVVRQANAGHMLHRDDVTEVLGIGRHSSTVIFLHGLGGRVVQVMPLVEHMRTRLYQASWVLPSAPDKAITALDGTAIPAWFDMVKVSLPKNSPMPTKEAEDDMRESVKRVHELIEDELAKGIDPDRIVISGFSQGCAISLLAAMSTPHKLGGVMCLSGWLPMAYKIKNRKHPMQTDHASQIPVFWGHGTEDNTIQYNWGEESVAYLSQLGFKDVDFRTYTGLTHWIEEFQYDDILEWLKKRIPPI